MFEYTLFIRTDFLKYQGDSVKYQLGFCYFPVPPFYPSARYDPEWWGWGRMGWGGGEMGIGHFSETAQKIFLKLCTMLDKKSAKNKKCGQNGDLAEGL